MADGQGEAGWGILNEVNFLTASKVDFGRLTEGGFTVLLECQTKPEV
jgi:hypothetical protein